MFIDSKYSKLLTILLVIVIIGIVGLLAFFGYQVLTGYFSDKDKDEFMADYRNTLGIQADDNNNNITGDFNLITNIAQVESGDGTTSNTVKKYKGFAVLGTIEIPKTGVDLPILDARTTKALNTSCILQYGPGPNEVGNTVIAGHNYRNGDFFSDNYKIENGDTIYITDNSGKRLRYVVYNKYQTTPEDADYMDRDTAGKPEISLTTCTDDSKARIIIWAKLAE